MPLEVPVYLMYVDESGDPGLPSAGSPSTVFCLSGLVVHESRWRQVLDGLVGFRHFLRRKFGIPTDVELHASDLISKPSRTHESYKRLRKHERLAIVRMYANELAKLDDIRLINVVLQKDSLERQQRVCDQVDVFQRAWYALLQRFENTLEHRNFPGSHESEPCDRGMVFADQTDAGRLRRFLNTMRQRNILTRREPNGIRVPFDSPIRLIVEDPVMHDSAHSYYVQAVDCAVFLFKQFVAPSAFMRKSGGAAYFKRFDPILCKEACKQDGRGMGIVEIR